MKNFLSKILTYHVSVSYKYWNSSLWSSKFRYYYALVASTFMLGSTLIVLLIIFLPSNPVRFRFSSVSFLTFLLICILIPFVLVISLVKEKNVIFLAEQRSKFLNKILYFVFSFMPFIIFGLIYLYFR